MLYQFFTPMGTPFRSQFLKTGKPYEEVPPECLYLSTDCKENFNKLDVLLPR